MLIRLGAAWENRLSAFPETGKGYQIVNVQLKDGRTIWKTAVIDHQIIWTNEFYFGDISNITVVEAPKNEPLVSREYGADEEREKAVALTYPDSTMSGTRIWVGTWKSDTVGAVELLCLLDRDEPGPGIKKLIDGGTVDKAEFETAVLEWLETRALKMEEELTNASIEEIEQKVSDAFVQLVDVYNAVSVCDLIECFDWFVGHSEEMSNIFSSVCDRKKEFWNKHEQWNDMLLPFQYPGQFYY